MSEEMKSEFTEVENYQVGDVVTGKVVTVEDSQALVDIGYKSEAILPISELASLHIEKASDVVKEGDELQLKVIRSNEEEDRLIVSKKAVDAEKAWQELQRKFEANETLSATVSEIVKGGLVVDVGVRGFIPASHVELHFVEDFSDYKGVSLSLKVIEIDPEKNKLILSRKEILEEEETSKRKKRLELLTVGEELSGTVQRLTDFGAFVDIGGVDGLVHVSELAWERVAHPSDVLNVGDEVKVKILKLDRESERISLSIKETQEGPWEKAMKEIEVDEIYTGKVKRLVKFGAFVELFPGVEGLVHVSQIANRHIASPNEALEEGQEVQVKVLDIVKEQKRISLSIKEVEQAKVKKEIAEFEEHANHGSLNVTLGDVYPELRNLNK
ncbi:30S ribosomal protein S1 [Hazenella sp. IB182357]|uniref:30S ribosomal protein S1 n=1 Tax=Polycladospora coralii TaxID=2771432 RepID=A0A926RTQ6_9BACL|nr:30S ribosomal protein S1 [Polycladospora coralii]MBD1371642.1 30S ribosomal protein S1 [Polycladospora coralii]MBS7529109.1 30S ribosomal protein S1 [Polycladospora coralii]